MKKILDAFIAFLSHLLSRRICIYIINKIIAVGLIHALKDPVYQVSVFLISSIFDLVIINELNFNKVNTNIEIKK